MIGWVIGLGYFLGLLISTRVASAQEIDRVSRYACNCSRAYGSGYHGYTCIKDRGRYAVVLSCFALSLLWPVFLPVYLVARLPTKAEKQAMLEGQRLEREKEIERLQKEYDL